MKLPDAWRGENHCLEDVVGAFGNNPAAQRARANGDGHGVLARERSGGGHGYAARNQQRSQACGEDDADAARTHAGHW